MTTDAVGEAEMSPKEHRATMVDNLAEPGALGGEKLSAPVEQALRTVARHQFVPEATLLEAYEPFTAVVTKRDAHGVATSSVSAPQVQAIMLEQAQLQPGDRVLEIGSGGYNAALIAEVTGPSGQVTTVDIDPDVTERARALLDQTGYDSVRVATVDAEIGFPEGAPYDAIIVTAGTWDIPPAWREQLVEGGRLVVPLRTRSITRSVGLVRSGQRLAGSSPQVCGFVPMQGAGSHKVDLLLVAGSEEIALRFDDGLPENLSLLDNAIRTPRLEQWSGVTVALGEPLNTLQLYLATHLRGFTIMAMDPDLDTGLVAPSVPGFSLAAVENGNFAYLLTRRIGDRAEYGVHAFGPEREALARKLVDFLNAWDQRQRGGPGPQIDVYPAGTPDEQLPGELVVDKRHSRISFSWPEDRPGGPSRPLTMKE